MLYVLNYSIKDIKRSVAKLEKVDRDRIRRQIILDKTAGRNCLRVDR